MICRLCLEDISEYEVILLFSGDESKAETKVAKMITKYFHLEITQDDTISTSICQDCFDHLEEFHKFWTYIDQQQSTLRNSEFLEVKCDVEVNSHVMEQIRDDIKQDEMLFDVAQIENANAEAAKMPSDEFEFGSSNPAINRDINETDASYYGASPGDNDSTDDDNTPLVKLKRKCTKKSSAKVKKIKKSLKQKNDTPAARGEREIIKHNNDLIKSFMNIVCDLCNETVDTFAELRTHFTEKHNCEPYMKCCDKKFRKAFKLVQHIKWHQNPDEFKCKICHKQLKSSYCLIAHRIVHSDRPPPSVCHICKKEFRSKKTFQNHMEIHENAKSYNCEICGKSFPVEQRLRNHIRSIHDNIYPHICDSCGKKFKNKASFERHILSHQGVIEEPAQCDLCNKWLKNKHSLRLHRMLHADKGIKCKECGRFCPSKVALRRHTRYMHELKNNLQCTFCDKTFKVTKSLEEHIATHTGAQLYSCPHCSRESRSQSNMYAHIKRDHVEEWIKLQMARSNDPNFKSKVQ